MVKTVTLITFLAAGVLLLRMGFEKQRQLTSYKTNDTIVTIIDVSVNKKSSLNPPIIIGALLVLTSTFVAFRMYYPKTAVHPLDKLTQQEKKILTLIGEEKTNKEIAIALSISVSTVKTHINNIYKKMDAKSRKELLQYC